MIIDAHCHAGKGDGLTGPWDTDANLGRYRARARAAGIDRTVIFAAFNSDYRRANREVADIVRADPGLFVGFAFVHPVLDRGRVGGMVREAVEELGFRGIKAHRQDGRMTREVAEVAPRLAASGHLRRAGRRRIGRTAGTGVPRRRLDHPAPRQLRR